MWDSRHGRRGWQQAGRAAGGIETQLTHDRQSATHVIRGQQEHERPKVRVGPRRVLVVREEPALLVDVDLVQLGRDAFGIWHELGSHLLQDVGRKHAVKPAAELKLLGHELVGLPNLVIYHRLVAVAEG